MNFKTNSTTNFASNSKANIKLAVISLTVVGIVIASLVASALILTPQDQTLEDGKTPTESDKNSWLFKGAYAKYKGTTTIMFMTFNVEMRQEVKDFNTTHAELQTFLSMDSDFGESEQTNTTVWIDLEENHYEIDDAKLTNKYEITETFDKFGSRECIVYEYSTEGPTWSFSTNNSKFS